MKRATVSGLLVASVLLGLLIAEPVAGAAGKGKPVSCNGGTVPVTVRKKTTCKPLAKALPKPRSADLRLAYLRQVLRFDPAKTVRGKKRRHVRTLQSGFGATGRRAQRKLLGVLPKALAFVDRRGGSARRLLAASGGCGPGQAGPTGQTGGASIGTLGDNGGYVDAPIGNGLRLRLTFYSCGGVRSFGLPDCPTAAGDVDGKGKGEFRVTMEIRDGNKLVSRNSSIFEDTARVHGQVGADAKLKSVEVEHAQEVFIVASGGVAIRGGVKRTVRIAMPGGSYGADVKFYGDSIPADSGARGFADTAAAAIGAYRSVEPGWTSFTPPGRRCAEPAFTPGSDALKLKPGDRGQLAVYAKARQDGGRATGAAWTLISPLNASFSPGSSNDAGPSFGYTVSPNPAGDRVRVTVKFTSTAGVGEGSWTEPIEAGKAINHLTGTFGGSFESAGGTLYTWSGSAKFDRIGPSPSGGSAGIYEMTSGSVSLTVSGESRRGEPEYSCQVSGSLASPELGKIGSALVTVAGEAPGQAFYEYSFEVFLPGTEPPEPILTVESSSCGEKAEELNGTTEQDTPHWRFFFFEPQLSPDGLDFSGEIDESFGETQREQHWSFHGSV